MSGEGLWTGVQAAIIHDRIHRRQEGCCCPSRDVACPLCPTEGHQSNATTRIAELEQQLAAAQQSQREAEAERDEMKERCEEADALEDLLIEANKTADSWRTLARSRKDAKLIDAITGYEAELKIAQAAVLHEGERADAAEAERNRIRRSRNSWERAAAYFNKRAEAAEAALAREQEDHSKRYSVLAGEIANLRGVERTLKTDLARAREALHEYHNADRGRWGQVWVPATRCHNEECRRAALEATQPRADDTPASGRQQSSNDA